MIERLRGMTEAGTADYTAGTTVYWSDAALQAVLDDYRNDVRREELTPKLTYGDGGSVFYYDYLSRFGNFEQTTGGTAIFYVAVSTGEKAGTANYSVDYQRGVVTFAADQGGTAYFLTGSAYDLNAAAAQVWRQKAAHLAQTAMDFSTDGHRFNRSQLVEHALLMAEKYDMMGGGNKSIEVYA